MVFRAQVRLLCFVWVSPGLNDARLLWLKLIWKLFSFLL